MFNSKLSQTFAIALVALTSVSCVSAVCGNGNEIGIGASPNGGVIVANDCGVIDSKSGGICGAYSDGSQVTCDNSGVPNSAQTPDGHNWGKCVGSSETCGSTQVRFCCS